MNAANLSATAELAASLSRPVVKPSGPSLLDLPHGFHEGIPEATYHDRIFGVASKSTLDLVLEAPAKYLAWSNGQERPETDALRFGKAIHAAILEPDRFAATYVIAPEFGPQRKTDTCTAEQAKENKTRKSEWMAEHAGATVLDSKSGRDTLGMIAAVAADPDARPLLESGIAEGTAVWTDEATGLLCKARIDFYRPDLETIIDLKSAEDARRWAWERSAEDYKYYRQDPWYRDALRALGYGVRRFVFVVVEKSPPYLVNVFSLHVDDVTRGRGELADAMRTLSECLLTNTWPGYPRDGIETIKLRPRYK